MTSRKRYRVSTPGQRLIAAQNEAMKAVGQAKNANKNAYRKINNVINEYNKFNNRSSATRK
jgi:hypothetical protein